MQILSVNAFDNGHGDDRPGGSVSYSVKYLIDSKAEFMRCGTTFDVDSCTYVVYGTTSEPSTDRNFQHAICDLVNELPAGERLLTMLEKLQARARDARG